MLNRFKDHFKKLKEVLPIVDEVTLSKKSSKYNPYNPYNHVSKPVHSDAIRIYKLKNYSILGFAFIDILEGVFIITLKQKFGIETISVINYSQLKLIFSTFFKSQSDKTLEEFLRICKNYFLDSSEISRLKSTEDESDKLDNDISDIRNKAQLLLTSKKTLIADRLQKEDYVSLTTRKRTLIKELSIVNSELSSIKQDYTKSPEIITINKELSHLNELRIELEDKSKRLKNTKGLEYLHSFIADRLKGEDKDEN